MSNPQDLLSEIQDLRARLQEAEDTLRAIREGEIDALVVSSPHGERIFTLKGAEHVPRIILQEMAEGVISVVNGDIVYSNRFFSRLAVLPEEKVVGLNIKSFLDPQDHARFQSVLERTRQAPCHGEFMFVDGQGRRKPVHISFNVLQTDSISGHCLIIRDLTELKKAQNELLEANESLELRVARRTEELAAANSRLAVTNDNLARSNRELEQFAYVSSHDLQEPLRTISVYVDLLKHSYHDKLDDRGEQFLNFIQEGSQRARDLIQGLLTYARIGLNEKPLEMVDINRLLDHAVSNLKALIDQNQAVITRDPLPSLQINDMEIMQLFQNLLSNAIKYRRHAPPMIHVSAVHDDHRWIFSVKDNGIGIEKEYLEYVFKLFKRLHNSSQYSGTGIGLSVCKKIVENHGGEIWVESRPNVGSTFYFTMPIKNV